MEETIDTSAIENGDNDFSLAKVSRVGGPVTCVAFSPIDPLANRDDRQRPSFFFVAQGPYLTRYTNETTNTAGDFDENDAGSVGVDDGTSQTQDQQLLVFPEDPKRPRGGGTIHGIHFLDHDGNRSPSWDAIVHGGKRLTFCNLLSSNIARRNVVRSFAEETDVTQQNVMKNNGTSLTSPFLELDDWTWNVKTFPQKTYNNDDGDKTSIVNLYENDYPSTNEVEMTMVIGYARHMIEVWNVKKNINSTKEAVVCSRLHRLFLNPPTVVTSMDFVFVNEEHQQKGVSSNESDALWIAAGTSFHKIWVSCIPVKDIFGPKAKKGEEIQDETVEKINPRTQVPQHHLLKGHSGVVHSVRWFQDGDRISLASTSDDRSVRKWGWDDARNQWIEKWTGWGHSARVWSVSTINSKVQNSASPSLPLLISVAEDGTARVWASESGGILACIHHSTTLWTVDTRNTADGGMFIIGGTDGISAIYNVCNHVSGNDMLTIDNISVPDDRPPIIVDKSIYTTGSSLNTGEEQVLTKKKKKRKMKTQSQVIVGVKCWRDGSTSSSEKVIVSTRQGSLMSFGIKERKWKICHKWWEPSLGEKFGIQANDGNSMAVCDGILAVAIGTTRGYIVLTSQNQEKSNDSTVLNARELRAVQGLTFLDSCCLVSFHVHSVALWMLDFGVFPVKTVPEADRVLKVETKGIPQSCAYDRVNQRVVVGDSRGNLVYFRTDSSDHLEGGEQNHVFPTCVLHKVHEKQHITSVKWLNQNTILSAGNDGCVHVSYLRGDILQKGWSYPAPSLTGITRIINSSLPTIVSGYHGNTFRVLDLDSGYEFIRSDTGGRQRILDCSFNIAERNGEMTTPDYQLVVCKAQKDGTNHLFVQYSTEQSGVPMLLKEHNHASKGVKLHGETIFDSTFFTLTSDVVFLVTASEDCSSRISACTDGHIVDSVLLTPQESCCRCVTVSQIDKQSALLVVGGGKLALQFFLIREGSNCTKVCSTRDLEIRFIGNGVISKKGATIDHRINSVSAVPIPDCGNRSHFVIAGDSEGSSHAFSISEEDHQNYRNPIGLLVPTTSQRPILCVECLRIGERILILMGTTGGNIDMFDLPASLSPSQGCWDKFSSLWNPIGSYRGHQMGTNAISVEILSLEKENGQVRAVVSIVSGGDDQALCTSRVSLEQADDCSPRLKLRNVPHLKVVPEASFSAIKGVSHVRFDDKRFLLSVGYSQQLSIWRFQAKDDMFLQCTSRLPVDLGDVNCLSIYRPPDESTFFAAVCGMGVEIFREENSDQFSKE